MKVWFPTLLDLLRLFVEGHVQAMEASPNSFAEVDWRLEKEAKVLKHQETMTANQSIYLSPNLECLWRFYSFTCLQCGLEKKLWLRWRGPGHKSQGRTHMNKPYRNIFVCTCFLNAWAPYRSRYQINVGIQHHCNEVHKRNAPCDHLIQKFTKVFLTD